MNTIINYKKTILKIFHKAYISVCESLYIITGRSAGKSIFVPDKLLYDFLKVDKGNIMVFRKHQNSLLRSSYEAIRKSIIKHNLEQDFEFIESRLIIEDRITGTRFYFFGLDDEAKIRSTVMKVGVPFRYWFEEFQENKKLRDLEQIDDLISTFFREKLPKGLKHQAIYTGNRPRNPNKPFNVYIDNKITTADEDDSLFVDSDYEEMVHNETGATLLSDQELARIERVKKRDPDTWLWRYKGIAVGDDTQIYNMDLVKRVKELPEDEFIIYIDLVIDAGYQVSATTFLAIATTNKLNAFLLDTYYFSPDKKIKKRIPAWILKPHGVANALKDKKAPSEFSIALHKFGVDINKKYKVRIDERYIDSAEGGLRAQYYKDFSTFLKSVKKKEKDDMIEDSRTVIVEKQLYVLDIPNNEIFWFEMTKYAREEEDGKNPKIIKVDDHTCDCWQYWSVMSLRKLGLKR